VTVQHNKVHSPGEESQWCIWFCTTQAGGN